MNEPCATAPRTATWRRAKLKKMSEHARMSVKKLSRFSSRVLMTTLSENSTNWSWLYLSLSRTEVTVSTYCRTWERSLSRLTSSRNPKTSIKATKPVMISTWSTIAGRAGLNPFVVLSFDILDHSHNHPTVVLYRFWDKFISLDVPASKILGTI